MTDPGDRAARLAFFEEARAYTGLMAVETNWGSFVFSTDDATVGGLLYMKQGRSEMAMLARAMAVLEVLGQRELAVAGLFLDVGANIGTTTVPAVHLYGFAGAVAYEPAPDNWRLLRMNLLLNGVQDFVQPRRLALSNETGKVLLALDPMNSGGHRVAADGRDSAWIPPGTAFVEVEQTSIDALVANGELCPETAGLLWIDAQGHEARIISGASELTQRGLPIVLEYYPEMLAETGSLDDFPDLLAGSYNCFIDLRKLRTGIAPTQELADQLRPIGSLDALRAEYETNFTDILVVHV